MTLFDVIPARKSVRKFKQTPLPRETLRRVEDFLQTVRPLDPGIRVRHRFVGADGVKGMFRVMAPHYLLIFSEEKEGYLENVGFMYQQADLFLSSIGVGACWLGMAKPTDTAEPGMKFVIMLALGEPDAPLHREASAFVRKPLAEITADADPRLPFGRLAPSAKNSQPWYVRKRDAALLLYRHAPKGLMARAMEPLNRIDMGIFLCHLWVAGEALKIPFAFETEPVEPLERFVFVGRIPAEP